ncbi:MAG: beta-galactosidase [Oceanospirillaceae bacterium]|nr:beta-galactosidase [Oceanospirillaceae bacterium]
MIPTLGVCYYPEHWQESEWSKDAAEMVAAGLTWVRIGEFAWSRIEPTPGQFEWDWLDRAIETLGNAGLKVVLGTPTATPPRWMLDKWPDMLAVDENGNPRKFGSRRHYCFSHQGYREESVRITSFLARRYGKNPHIHAWQIDNEYGCHDTIISYSAAAQKQFHIWLEQRYGTVAKLNEAWGNVFWSMEYDRFDQIELPNLTVTEANPSHRLDFHRFSSYQVAVYNRAQVEVLRQYSSAPLIHNYMGRILEFDHFEVGADLDIASWDSYPLGFLEDRVDADPEWKRHFAQQGDPDFQALHHDLYRAVGRGRWWVMEQQPGPVNWAPNNPAPLPGMIRVWTWEALAHGAEALLYFRWRQAPFAQEQMHTGLKRPDNKAAMGFAEAKQVALEIAEGIDTAPVKAQVAILFDYESAWAWRVQPQGENFDYFRVIFEHYKALRSLGLSIDFIDKGSPILENYKLILAPAVMHMSQAEIKRIQSHGATLILGPRSSSKTEHFAINSTNPILPGFNLEIDFVETLRSDTPRQLQRGGAVQYWQERIETDAPVLEIDNLGHPIRVGSDTTQYLAAWLDQAAMKRIYSELCNELSIEYTPLPEGVRVRDTQTHRFYFNYDNQDQSVNGVDLPPASVIWQSHSIDKG